MNYQGYTQPAQLERYSFLWSQARLVIGALALFIGGVPPVLKFFPGMFAVTWPLLKLSWIISGVASVYLIYRWQTGKQTLFGGKAPVDSAAFLVSVVSGINLGLTGLLGSNIGMSISSSKLMFVLVGLLYLAAAYQLQQRWNQYGKKIL